MPLGGSLGPPDGEGTVLAEGVPEDGAEIVWQWVLCGEAEGEVLLPPPPPPLSIPVVGEVEGEPPRAGERDGEEESEDPPLLSTPPPPPLEAEGLCVPPAAEGLELGVLCTVALSLALGLKVTESEPPPGAVSVAL